MTGERVWVRCVERFVDRETGDRRTVGEEWETGFARARKLSNGLVYILTGPGGEPVTMEGDPWCSLEGRDLRTVTEDPAGWWVVACLNVWNDAEALAETLPTWVDHVDRIIAVDGAYAGAPARECASTDDTLAVLAEHSHKVTLVHAPRTGFWPDQVTKRNAYMELLEPGDLCFIVDADEFVEGADCLRGLGPMEVGWVPYRKGIYVKEQNFPRLYDARIHPRYHGRHYWVEGDRGPVTDCQWGGPGYDHAWVPLRIDNTQGKSLRPITRTRDKNVVQTVQANREAKVGPQTQSGRESLRIVQLGHIDPGMVVFRLHTAINATTPHTSIMGTHPHDRPWAAPRQYDIAEDRDVLRRALVTCDLVHCHMSYQVLDQLGVDIRAPVVIHHHGTMYRRNPEPVNGRDAQRAAVRLASNPELLKYGENLNFLPNPVPVTRYKALRARLYRPDPQGYLRVGHSPSKRELKGTEVFLEVVETLRSKGVKIRPVLIEDRSHEECLRIKAAECDAFFDSFWLGMQCSGLEAGAMGIPVVAGDEDVQRWHLSQGHLPPYMYAPDRAALLCALDQLALFHAVGDLDRLAAPTLDYVTAHHDYAAVTARYLDILDERLDWRRRLTLSSGQAFLTR